MFWGVIMVCNYIFPKLLHFTLEHNYECPQVFFLPRVNEKLANNLVPITLTLPIKASDFFLITSWGILIVKF